MKLTLTKTDYSYKAKESIANMFIIGNGHIGYKGTMEEELCDDKVTFNIIGEYDQYKDKWRESLNLFNPLYLSILVDDNPVHYKECLSHKLTLKINEATIKRVTEFEKITLKIKRFIPTQYDDVIMEKIAIFAKEDCTLTIRSGIDSDVYEINGPHYVSKTSSRYEKGLLVKGKTNENKKVYVYLKEVDNDNTNFEIKDYGGKIYKEYKISLKRNETFELAKTGIVEVGSRENLNAKIKKYSNLTYYKCLKEHVKIFSDKFEKAMINFNDSVNSDFALNYSIYELMILGNENYQTSIPARGLSGQVYKGAIFWDTEVFMLPFFLSNNTKIAKNLCKYRINTLKGALIKAKTFGFDGAFYAWESQEDGQERCSLYNVTDAKTGAPVRTYFADKQIHISIDVLYGLLSYINYTNDLTILDHDANLMALQIIKFYMSYANNIDGFYHLNDVIGPDEYHERINDNAFTNYSVKFVIEDYLKLIEEENVNIANELNETNLTKEAILDFINHLYLPKQNQDGVIEQFAGYFDLENVTYNDFKSRITNTKEYLGGENGIANKTQIIKQADTCALLALHPEKFDLKTLKANFDYYFQRTEHGSSLSNSMYSLLASQIGYSDIAYDLFYKSASIDLKKSQKLYAGGIFIGGTHPASNGGAFIDFVYGFLGMKVNKGVITFDPHLPKNISNVTFTYLENNEYKRRTF